VQEVKEAHAESPEMKPCTQCGEIKPLEAFGWSRAGRSRMLKPRPACKVCRVEAEKARYRQDPGPNKARAAAWYVQNRARAIANSRRSAQANPERARAAKDAWAAKNPEKRRANLQRRRARLRGGETEKFSDVEIFERDGWVCGICGEPIDRTLKAPDGMSVSLDHIIPVSKDGAHKRANVQAAHLQCNRIKSAALDLSECQVV
jgi:5-methylcytosine-specific restriction endonuclease McrA